MNLIQNAIDWDKLLDNIEENAAANAAMKLLDPAIAIFEKHYGLRFSARQTLFGDKTLPYKSLILNYVDALKAKAREERNAGDADFDSDSPEHFAADGAGRSVEPESTLDRLKRTVAEALEPAPKILPGDVLTPRERILRHMNFEKPDRVAVAPLWGFHTARAGGINTREFMTDGHLAALASRRAWDLYGGFDMTPANFSAGYMFPLVPESHSRFCSNWFLPEGDELPKLDEQPLDLDYDMLNSEGFSPILRTERGRLFGELRRMLVQTGIFYSEMAVNFPRPDLFHPYAMGVINHPADLLSMWLGFERFMTDCALDPLKVREACERLGPGLVEFGEFTARLGNGNQVLYGVSRVSASYISRKMFDNLFAGVFIDQVRQAFSGGFNLTYHLDNNYTPFLDFFLELPRHSGYLHLDQTDIFEAKKVIGDHLCLMGNLHPGMLAMGKPAELTAHCERLIKEVGAGGGFILSSACEVPINTPVENLKAVKEAVDRWGWY
ncbi:MAG: uroporphyrinogen decarboxylase family protein [bacterium]